MSGRISRIMAAMAVTCAALTSVSAHASLTTFQTFVGNYGVSTDGWGGTSSSGTISAFVPVGATVVAAYLYTTTNNNGGTAATVTSTLAGSGNINYTNLGVNSSACCNLAAGRADVTSIIKPLVDGGPGGTYNFTVTESNSGVMDGEALVVVYSLPSLGITTIGILDGAASSAGDSATLSFAAGIDKTVPGFTAEMRLGIGFSYNDSGTNQTSTVTVNGQTLTNNAGNFDDGAAANGALITVGGSDDPLSPANPSVALDHERYDLSSFINQGDTAINIRTTNSSFDDNIFLALFQVSGEGTVCTDTQCAVPEPTMPLLVGGALLGLGLQRRRSQLKKS